ncbi:MAG TPA: hypothetical protein ENH82_02605, partial [bacterium]|nr:hypothetical protein [bacterium]
MTRATPKPRKIKRAEKPKMTRAIAIPSKKSGKVYGSYQPWMNHVAGEMVGKFGARSCDLATVFEVGETTIDHWIKNRPGFANAVHKARLKSMTKVAQAMYQLAVGYSHPDIH